MVRDPDWYTANSRRPWPLDETASLLDDAQQVFPENLLVDLSLRFPARYGPRAYLGAFYSGPAAVSLLILGETGYTPLAAFQASRAGLETGRLLPLTPLVAGVGGWVVLGEGTLPGTLHNFRFREPSQSRLLPQTARPYAATPVLSLGKLGAEVGLTGLVKLSAGNDIELVQETLTIDGRDRTAVVINLRNTQTDTQRNLLSLYAGPCGGRPESRTCPGPQPIEAINTVIPDCCGTIFLEFRGCASVSRVQNDSRGVIVDCGLSLADACVTPARLPDASGRLPNEYQDQCDPDSEPPTTAAPESVVRSLPAADEGPVLTEAALSSLGGDLDIIIPNNPQTETCTVVFSSPHGLQPGDRFQVYNCTQPFYDCLHTVLSVDNAYMLVSDVPFLVDGHNGSWLKIL